MSKTEAHVKNIKKKSFFIMLFSGIGFLVGLVLVAIFFLSGDDDGIPLLISGIVIIIPAVILIGVGLLMSKAVNHYCNICCKPLYGCEYGYREKGRRYVQSTTANGSDKLICTYEIWWICPHCRSRQTITKDYNLLGGGNVEHKVEEYCRNRFRNEKHRAEFEAAKYQAEMESMNTPIQVDVTHTHQMADQSFFCGNCGGKNPHHAVFCGHCGAPVTNPWKKSSGN